MIIICGIGYFEEQLIANIKDREVIAIELDKEKAARIESQYPHVKAIIGDASSVLAWKKIDLENVQHIITAFKDADVSLEICFFIRKTFKLDIPILVISYSGDIENKFAEFGVTLINPLEMSINLVINKLNKNYSKAIDIGIRKGELIEMNVLSKSHLTDRKLKNIRPSNWHVAAIYRNNEIVIPTGNVKIKVGDKVIIFGEPKVLENLANIFLKGIPQFPLQYGKIMSLYIFSDKDLLSLSGSVHLFKHIRSQRLEIIAVDTVVEEEKIISLFEKNEITKDYSITPAETFFENLNRPDNGINVFIQRKSTFFKKLKIKQILKETSKPTALMKNGANFSKILVSLNSPDMTHILEIAVELARLFKVEVGAVYATLPKALRNEEDAELLQESYTIVNDFKSIYKINIDYTVIEGNPVRETLRFLSKEDSLLFIIGYERFNPGSFFKPSVAYHLATKTTFSTILIPQSVD
ncbi:NAD-binding protein [Deferribacteraceae bacterium V6Fe1]|nr:NAD-binding protein [Deferribacteraceae bacterium V6Fe1]